MATTTCTLPWSGDRRLGGLRRFATAITILNILGHTLLGFEQSWAQPLVALATAWGLELLIEALDARWHKRPPRFAGGPLAFVDFGLSAHISGLAVSMLLYANERLLVVAFAAAVAIASKNLIRMSQRGRSCHVFNPSNFGITVTLLLFPWVGIAPPYQFTENLGSLGDVLLPCVIIASGSFLNWRFTQRLPLIATWLTMFAAQAVTRSLVMGTPPQAALLPMTGVAFLLFTFYMVTDPATTPSTRAGQVAFGAAVALVYCGLMLSHVVFGLFFSLTLVTIFRAAWIYSLSLAQARAKEPLLAGVSGAAPTSMP